MATFTRAEYDALLAASVAFDGEHMDDLDDASGYGAKVRRERAALDRVLSKVRADVRPRLTL